MCTPQEVDPRRSPDAFERPCQSTRRDVAALPRSLRVARNVSEGFDLRLGDHLCDESRGVLRKSTPAPLLPLPDEKPRAFVVDDRRPRT